ncbi:hypothetical protein CLOM_g23076 [Closterium sp. NIES-68]|nr:hypothetical protein CLOM_g23076 [Closterium sp. NIES-68]GJP61516.1 hypothetical protein CLOP_g18669 [Closterium sp. NIES-67]
MSMAMAARLAPATPLTTARRAALRTAHRLALAAPDVSRLRDRRGDLTYHVMTSAMPHRQQVTIAQATAALHRAEPVSTPEVEALLDSIKWDEKGLVVAIAQHADTGAILMQGFADRDAVSATLASDRATFFSRSRKCLWTKGETSGHFINVLDMYIDCDRDTIIYRGIPDGPTCHTGTDTCFFTKIDASSDPHAKCESASGEDVACAQSTLFQLEGIIAARKKQMEQQQEEQEKTGEAPVKPSWTARLLSNHSLLCSKIREEADELCQTLEGNETSERAASEMADVLYHSMVLLAVKGVKMEDVVGHLRNRFSMSGIDEKASRSPKNKH